MRTAVVTTRYIEVVGVGPVVRLQGGRMDGMLCPLRAFSPWAVGGPLLSPDTLKGPMRMIYNPHTGLMKGEEEAGPGDHLYTEAVYHFAGYEEWNGLTVPKLSLLYENDVGMAMRGVLAANSFLYQPVDKEGNIMHGFSMGENLIDVYPAYSPFKQAFMDEWNPNTSRIEKDGTSRNIPFKLVFDRIGESAGIGQLSMVRHKSPPTIFVMLSGKSEAEEMQAILQAQKMTPFLPKDAPIWKSTATSSRPALIVMQEEGRAFDDAIIPLAWVFFRKMGVL
jgi:hypothetical protein